jgi:hypothetical protein
MPNCKVVVAGLCALGMVTSAGTRRVAESSPRDASTAARRGLTVFIDPQSGKLLDRSAPEAVPLQLSDELVQATRTDDLGLWAEVGPRGGASVDLQGRARQPLVAHVEPGGRITIYHLPVLTPRSTLREAIP